MVSDEFLASEILGHGAYLCLRRSGGGDLRKTEAAPIEPLAERLGLRNEFDPGETPPIESIAFLRRQGSAEADIADDAVVRADWVVHVAAARPETIGEFCAETTRLLSPAVQVHVLHGVRRPLNYTGAAMNKWAYERRILQQPGPTMPNAFLVPMSKTAEWWGKDWMERHTYFLPRYDDQGRILNEGHALVAEAGIACLLRRTYRSEKHPAPESEYDFLNYFECADSSVPTFHQVCAALRDVTRNPEWRFVREGPTWHGRRVASWKELIS
jgi:hypothetical protein